MIDPLNSVVAATLAGDAGGALGLALGKLHTRRLHSMVWLAAGAMLAITLLDMIPESYAVLGGPLLLLALTLGYGLMWAITRLAPVACPACSFDAFDGESFGSGSRAVWLMVAALAVHCTLDGIGFVSSDHLLGHPDLGLIVGLSVHKIPEGLALTLMLLGAGFRRTVAVLWSFLAESFTLVGGVLASTAAHALSQAAVGGAVAFVAGGFVYLLVGALRPKPSASLSNDASRIVATAIGFGATGALLWITR